jgi:hypothetical protein
MRTFLGSTLNLLAFLLLGWVAVGTNWAAVPISPPVERSEPDEDFIQYTLPRGTAFQVLLQTPIDTSISQINDPVEVIMVHNLYLLQEMILPKSTRFNGSITRLEPPIQGMNAILQVNFSEIILNNGEKMPISAHVRTERPDHTWGGQVTSGTKPVLSTQRVWEIGEYNRIVFAGPRAMGEHVKFPPGEHWTLILDEPLTILNARE